MEPLKVIEAEGEAFANKDLDKLFSEFYAESIEVYNLKSAQLISECFSRLKNGEIQGEKAIELVINDPSDKMFDDISFLKDRIRKQFEDLEWIKVGTKESVTYQNYLFALQTKKAPGKDLEVFVLYDIKDNKIARMWQALV